MWWTDILIKLISCPVYGFNCDILTLLCSGWLCDPFWGLHIWENFNKVYDRWNPAEGITEGVWPGPLQCCYYGWGSRTLPQYWCSVWPAAWGTNTLSSHSSVYKWHIILYSWFLTSSVHCLTLLRLYPAVQIWNSLLPRQLWTQTSLLHFLAMYLYSISQGELFL